MVNSQSHPKGPGRITISPRIRIENWELTIDQILSVPEEGGPKRRITGTVIAKIDPLTQPFGPPSPLGRGTRPQRFPGCTTGAVDEPPALLRYELQGLPCRACYRFAIV